MSSPGAVAKRLVPAATPATFRSGNSGLASLNAAAVDTAAAERFPEEYLKGLQALVVELEAGMSAIAGNDLGELEQIVRRQEVLCMSLTGLSRLRGPFRPLAMQRGQEMTLKANRKPGPVSDELNAALFSLDHLSRCYKSLLQHSGRSFQLLDTLCGAYMGQTYDALHLQKHAGRPLAGGSNYQTWDCEI